MKKAIYSQNMTDQIDFFYLGYYLEVSSPMSSRTFSRLLSFTIFSILLTYSIAQQLEEL
jgi:hypothetical protein